MLANLHELAFIWDPSFLRNDPEGNSQRFVTGCNTLIHQLSTLMVVGSNWEEGIICESLHLAMLLFACRGATNGHAIKRMLKLNAQNLRLILERDEVVQAWTAIPGALVWCLFVGSTEEDCLDTPWFIAQLMQVTTGYTMLRWEHLKHSALVFTWLIQCSRAKAILER